MARIAYFGTGDFALPALRTLATHHEVALVVSQPDRPTGRGLRTKASPVSLLARELGLSLATPERARDSDFVDQLRALNVDALVVASYGQILSTRLLESAQRGGINLHGSILPRYRGAAPIQRAIRSGDTETGVTLMQMDKGMDTGDIIDIARTDIEPDEIYGDLQDRLALLAGTLIKAWLPRIVDGDYPRHVQDSACATLAAKIDRTETALDFHQPADEEYRRFRAFTPAPGVSVETQLGRIKFRQMRWSTLGGAPGEVLSVNPLIVAHTQHALEWRLVQPEGKKAMSGRDFANGARLTPGTRLIE